MELEGPGGAVTGITDCVEANPADCTGIDKNPEAGEFTLEGLAWGDYTLIETKAPAGYLVNSGPHEFSISLDNLTAEFVEGIVNEQRDGPSLPLTGGLGRDHVYVAGVLTILLSMGAYLGWRRRQA